jgi:hypothetical protein
MVMPSWYVDALRAGVVDPGRIRGDVAVGLRDGALFALLAAGLTFTEASAMTFRAFSIHSVTGCVRLTVDRGGWTCTRLLDGELSARLLAWVADARGWNTDLPVFQGLGAGDAGRRALSKIVERYQRKEEAT